jgi:predicted nuclease of predicted toxin-antitoxin system
MGASPTDTQTWKYARREELGIVTKDADFSGRIILHTPPPWVVPLRFRVEIS